MIRLAVRCRPELAERVLADLVQLAPGGVEEETGPGWVEYAIYGAPGELPALPDLEAAVGNGLVEVTSQEIPDDWADRWQDFHEAISIAGGRIVVRPSWEPRPTGDPARADARAEQPAGIDVVVDPGQAFGTGAHPTTRMCLELLLDIAEAGEARGPLADWGTGSGVLAIAAAKLGFDPVVGCDQERAALDAAAACAQANGVDLRLVRNDLREAKPPPAPTVTANLTAPVLRDVAARIEDAPERLVCSGMLASEVDSVVDAFALVELRVRERRASGDWAALLLEHATRSSRLIERRDRSADGAARSAAAPAAALGILRPCRSRRSSPTTSACSSTSSPSSSRSGRPSATGSSSGSPTPRRPPASPPCTARCAWRTSSW